MERLDGDDVLVNDRVYHLGFGWGTVTAIENSGFFIQLDSSSSPMRIFSGGYWQGRRMVYWHEPVLLALPKCASAGRVAQMRALVKTMEINL
jgi:hypothetical protein